MNKTQTFFSAPVTAPLLNPSVYADAAGSSGGRGVLYSLYLAGISTVLFMMIFSAAAMPKINAFADWVRTNMPPMIWTPAGLSLENGQTRAELTHPEFGKIAVFDMTKTASTEADMENAYVFVTAQRVLVKRAPGQVETRDITGAAMTRPGQQLPQRVRITGDIAAKLYQNIKGTLLVMIPIMMLFLSFVFLLVVNLLYSLAGLLFNQMRKEKLGYGAVFNLACFATTAVFLLAWIRGLLSFKGITWPPVLDIPINLVYLYLVFKMTDKKPAA